MQKVTNIVLAGNNYIEKIAHSWNIAVNNYINHKDNISLIRDECLDIQYQPKGNRNIKWLDFLGEKIFSALKLFVVSE